MFDEASAPSVRRAGSFLSIISIIIVIGSRRSSQYVRFDQVELLLGHREVPHVPEDPEDQAEEDQQRPAQHEKVPETQRCKDPE